MQRNRSLAVDYQADKSTQNRCVVGIEEAIRRSNRQSAVATTGFRIGRQARAGDPVEARYETLGFILYVCRRFLLPPLLDRVRVRKVQAGLSLQHRQTSRQFGFSRLLARFILDRRTNLPVFFKKLLKLDMEPLCNNERVPKPVGRPDTKNRPAKAFQHSLTNFVPVTSSSRGVVPRPVAFDASEVAAGVVRVHDAEIHTETGCPNLGPNLQPLARSASATASSKGSRQGRVNPRRAKGAQ